MTVATPDGNQAPLSAHDLAVELREHVTDTGFAVAESREVSQLADPEVVGLDTDSESIGCLDLVWVFDARLRERTPGDIHAEGTGGQPLRFC